jgi:protein-tyrosine phosphatase
MIKQGDNVLVHCRGGLGRSGTIAALLLIEFGLPNGLAVAQVRIARPGAIDIAEQEEYVRRYVALSTKLAIYRLSELLAEAGRSKSIDLFLELTVGSSMSR